MKSLRHLLLLAAACLLTAAPGAATTYMMVSDADLANQASAVVDVRIASVEPALVGGRPATDYTVEIERLLAGSAPGTTLIVRVPGGVRPDGIGFHVYGAPRFVPGERAILFLEARSDGTFGILHLGLGAFHRIAAAGMPPLAIRDLGEAVELSAPGQEPDSRRHQARDFDAFSAWLADRATGLDPAADYFVEAAAPGSGRLQGKFTLFGVSGLNLRWFEFDRGARVDWYAHSGGEPGLDGGGYGQFQQALQVWNSDRGSNVNLAYAGKTSARGGLQDDGFDGRNVLLQADPNDEIPGTFRCGSGGTLAIGGPWFDTLQKGSYQGRQYLRILGADIVMNDGLGCLQLTSSCGPQNIAAVYAHELGHTLGIGHSCGDSGSPPCAGNPVLDDALMNASARSCRGPHLGSDDMSAVRRLYGRPGGGTGGPKAPADLQGELVEASVRLRWSDASDDETGFRIYRSTDGAPAVEVATVGAGVTVFLDDDIAPATRYEYRVAAFNAQGESTRSNQAQVTVPPVTPVSVGLSTAPGVEVRVGEPVDFLARFDGPAATAEWNFGLGEVGFNDTPCAAETFCRSHVFTAPGPRTVEVSVTGSFGQVAHDTMQVQVVDAPFEVVAGDSFLQWTIFGRRGDTGTFESNVWLHNAGGAPARVELAHRPRGLEAPPAPHTLTLDPAETLFLPNVLEKVFGVSAGQGSLSLHVEQERGPDAVGPRVFAVSRSFVELANRAEGSFGLFVPEQGEAAWTTEAKVATGILEGDGFLSTLLGVNVDDRPGRVDVELFDRNGLPVGDPAGLQLGPGVMRFRPTADLFPEVAEREGPFTARFTSNGIRFLASSTLLETGSEDQIFIPAREPSGSDELIVPRVVRSPGQFGVFLTTSVSVRNEATVSTDVTFQLLLRGQNNAAPLEIARTVPAGGLLFLEDVIDEFGLETGTGALRVLWDNAQGVAPRVAATTLSENPRGDRFGMLIDSVTPADAVTGVGVDFGIEQSSLFKSQYGAVSLADRPTRIRLTLRDANGGDLGQTEVTLKPRQHLELNLVTLFGAVAAEGRNWSVTTEVLAGGPVITYLANINTSGDIFFVPGHPRLATLEEPGG